MERGIRLVFPNSAKAAPGSRIDFWSYDAAEVGWFRYGQGTVGRDGRTIKPDAGVVIRHFTCAFVGNPGNAPGTGPPPGGERDGDPVDLATGLFVYDKADLVLPDVLPIALRRTYRQSDPVSRPFGIGATHAYELHLVGDRLTYSYAELVLPDGGRIKFDRTSPGTGYTDAVMEATSTPTAFVKSVLSWNPQHGGWDLRLKDGTIYEFGVDWFPEIVLLKAIEDRFGNRLDITRGTNNRITQIRSPNGRTLDFSYDGSHRVTQIQDNIGRTATYTYDGSGRLWKATDVAGGVTEYTYDTSHRMLTVKDPRGIVYLTNEYDANGRISKQTLANAGLYEFAYTLDVNNRVVQTDVTDPGGFVRRVTFNATGYSLTDTAALGQPIAQTTTYVRQSPSNRIVSLTDALSRQTTFSYDGNGNLTSVTRLAGTANAVTTTMTYEPTFHQLASITDPLNHTTTFSYDSKGALSAVTDPLTNQTTFTSNNAGQPVTVTNALNETTTLGYAAGDVVSLTTPLGHVHTRFFDAAGRLLQTLDPGGQTVRFEYSALNQLTKIIDSLGGQTAFTYDGNGNLLTLSDARSKTTTWTYNNMDRVATRTDPLNREESFSYDLMGNTTAWTDRKGQVTTYQYDALNRQTLAGFGTAGTPPTYQSTIGYTWDAGDRVTHIVDSGAGTIVRGYDLLDRLTSETTPEGVISYTYDAANRRVTMQVAGQTTVSYGYDNADRLTGVTQGTASVAIAHDDADRRTSVTLPNGMVLEYAYDDDSQLTGITYKHGGTAIGTLAYGYDANGQRTSVGGTWARTGLPAALASATYDDANQIATFAGVSFTYDNNGNLTNDGTRSYNWNPRNQLASLTGPANGSFAYDGVGRRRAKAIGGTTTEFLYDGLNAVQELSGGTPSANVLAGHGLDEWFSRSDGAGRRDFLTDVVDSTVALADAAGSIQTSYTYEPFGQVMAGGASTTSSLMFTGREADSTGLTFHRARYYDPRMQRFVSEDPIGFEGGDANLHAFVANDPLNRVDPLGYAEHGKRRLDVHLPNGEILNKRTPIEKINQVISEAAQRGLSKETIKALKGLQKVVRRGGAMAVAWELLDPEVLESAECPAGPGTCKPWEPPSPPTPPRPPRSPGGSGPSGSIPANGSLPGHPGTPGGNMAGRKS
jgi:RHS repeat-associated protein